MKFSYNWIREFVDGLDTPPEALERLITMKTAECEGVERVGGLLSEACPARVESVEAIRDSQNRRAVVDTNRYGRKTVVCGAPNCRPGLVTAYIPAGKKVIQGVESDGMLASGEELGINRDHSGVVELEGELPPPDSVIEIDNKSITHRPDLWGHYGMAREVAAITNHKLIDPVKPLPAGGAESPIHISIDNLDLCPRYSAVVFENVTIRPSPLWLQYRLTSVGLNPINNIVDLTNYIMAELAQPMHAFDRDLLRGDTIYVRNARDGERILALNDMEYELTPANLVIADAGRAIALAGVIGGRESAIGGKTTRIVLESANFQAASIRKTSTSQKLRTDASMRFEKSQDPANTVRGLSRFFELAQEVSPGIRMAGGLADRQKELMAPPPISLHVDWVARKLGRQIDSREVRRILESLGFSLSEATPGELLVSYPSWRGTKDISMADDLVEEVGRMVGYDSIPPAAPAVAAVVPPDSPERLFLRSVRNMFAAQGFTEVYNYSFVSEKEVERFGLDPAAHVRVTNPIAEDQSLMRASLLPGIYRNIVENSKHFDSFRLFEIGREIHKRAGELPDEAPHLIAAIFSKDDGREGLLEAKRAAECIAATAEVRPTTAHPHEHPARAAEIVWDQHVIGRLAELHPTLVEGRAAVLDIDLRLFQEGSAGQKKYTPVRRYPSSFFDLSVVAPERVAVSELQSRMSTVAGPLLEEVTFLRVYPLAERLQSVSFRIRVGATDHTLSSDDATAVRARIIEGMRGLGYDLRI